MLAVRRSDASEPFHRALDFYHWPQWRDTAGESRKVCSERLKNWVGKRYERCDLKKVAGSAVVVVDNVAAPAPFAVAAAGDIPPADQAVMPWRLTGVGSPEATWIRSPSASDSVASSSDSGSHVLRLDGRGSRTPRRDREKA